MVSEKQDRQGRGKGEIWESVHERKREQKRRGGEIVRRLTSCILPGRRRLYRAPLHVPRVPLLLSPAHVRAEDVR